MIDGSENRKLIYQLIEQSSNVIEKRKFDVLQNRVLHNKEVEINPGLHNVIKLNNVLVKFDVLIYLQI